MITVQVSKGGYGRSGHVATEDSWLPGQTVITDGTSSVRVEDTGDGSRSYRIGNYADRDVTAMAPFRYTEAVMYWTNRFNA